MSYKQEAVQPLADRLKASGFRVFIGENGEYGFFTDEAGTKIVSFQTDLGVTSFSGNYKTDKPRETGTGWRITDNDSGKYQEIFDTYPPTWATKGSKWKYTTLEQHLDMYQRSSKYTEQLNPA